MTVRQLIRLMVAVLVLQAPLGASAGAEAWLDEQRQAWGIPGLVAVVVKGQGDDELFALGDCALAPARPCTPDTRFPIASTTKFFTGLLAAELVVQGEVALRDPIESVWPEFRLADARWQVLTLIDLLSQRSGIGSVDWPYFWSSELTQADYLARLPHLPMAGPFRSGWHYANANFVIAGEYLHRATQRPWRTLMRERLLAPLQISDTGAQPGAARGYRRGSAGFDEYAFPMSPAIGPAGALHLSAREYGRFLRMVLGEGQLGDESVLAQRTIALATQITAPLGYDRRFFSGPSGYGLGVFIARYRDQSILYHGGGCNGFTTHFAILPDAGIAVAVMANRVGTAFSELAALDLLDHALGSAGQVVSPHWLQRHGEYPPDELLPSDAAAPPTRPWPDYAGEYAHPAWGSFAVAAQDQGLSIRFGEFRRKLRPHRYDSFSLATEPGFEQLRLRFTADFAGNIDGFVLDDGVNAEPMRFRRRQAN